LNEAILIFIKFGINGWIVRLSPLGSHNYLFLTQFSAKIGGPRRVSNEGWQGDIRNERGLGYDAHTANPRRICEWWFSNSRYEYLRDAGRREAETQNSRAAEHEVVEVRNEGFSVKAPREGVLWGFDSSDANHPIGTGQAWQEYISHSHHGYFKWYSALDLLPRVCYALQWHNMYGVLRIYH
jgi:hypothetical protein